MVIIQLLDRAAASQPRPVPRRIECNIGGAQPFYRHSVDAARRRPLLHLIQMQPQQRRNAIPGKVILDDAQAFDHGCIVQQKTVCWQ